MKVVALTPESTNLQESFVQMRTRRRPDYNSTVWHWLEKHPLADQMHRWVLVTDAGEAVGHLAATPQYYRIRGQRIIAHTPADYLVLPPYGFYALSLMRTFFRSCENCVACDQAREAALIEKRFGAEEVGRLRYATKVLDLSQLSKLPSAIPAAVPKLLNRGLRLVDKALITSFVNNALEVEEIEEFNESFDEFFEKVAANVPCLPEKDAGFLRWRYGAGSPHAPVTVLGIKSEEGLLGYTVLRVTAAAPRYGYIFDLTALPQRHDVAGVLLREALLYFARLGIYAIRSQILESPTAPLPRDFVRLGFFGERDPNMLLVRLSNPALQAVARISTNWSYSAGDGEATFWVR